MNKLNFYLVLLFIIFSTLLTYGSINKSNLKIINHQIVYPKILSPLNLRSKRSINNNNNNNNNKIVISIGDWILQAHTTDSQLIISTDFTINWIASNKSKIPNLNSLDNCQTFYGHVLNNDKSIVVMTTCDLYFYIIFILNQRVYAVYPLKNDSYILEESDVMNHNLLNNFPKFDRVKRQENAQIKNNIFNLTGDTFDLIGNISQINIDDNKYSAFDSDRNNNYNYTDNIEKENNASLSYFTSSKWPKTKIAPKPITIDETQMPQTAAQWLELGVAVDYSVIGFHGERVQQYIFALLNIVSAIYRDPSLGANLTIVIVRMIFHIDKKNHMIHQGNARKSLENVNKWNRKILAESSKIHDVAVWLTRLDIGGPSGYAPVSGACDPSRSCALNRDEGLTSAFIIAHELAHILGLTHDGDDEADNSCSDDASIGSVMAPIVAATFHRFNWSPCSRKEFFHQSRQWKCMNNPPDVNNPMNLKTMLREVFTMDEQCRTEFGKGYELCKNFNLPGICSHLWCARKNESQVCRSKKVPPLEGTLCDKDKWCINGYCETIDNNIFVVGSLINNSVDSKWSPWSLWSKCSVTCGVGVRIRSRQCNYNNLIFISAKLLTKSCSGSSLDFEICKQSECTGRITDLKSEQCSQLSNIIHDGRELRVNRINWLPYEHQDENFKCRLTCRNVETKEIYISNDFLIDGTRCSYDTTNICIQGKCHLTGCDNVINSKKGFDQCGICDATTRIAIVPSASYDISVGIKIIPLHVQDDSTMIMFRDAQRRKHGISLNSQSYNSTTVVEGTKFKVQRNGNQYEITGRGPTLQTVTISLKISKSHLRTGDIIFVNLRYVINRHNDGNKGKYSWISGGWGPCTLTCGAGVRHRTVACRNDETGRIVSENKCLASAKPVQEIEKCNNFSCQFKWIAGVWEGCTKTCGASGVQHRQIYCVHSSLPINYITNDYEQRTIYRAMVSPNLCNQYQIPNNRQECNLIPCQGNWIFTDWSPCTRSCGKGIQSRMARCVPPEMENLFTCNGTAPDELRSCKNFQLNLRLCRKYCKQDTSRYCIIPNLKKYCIVPEFRKRCCHACSN